MTLIYTDRVFICQ